MLYAFIGTHQTVYLQWLYLVVCELYLDKGGFYVSVWQRWISMVGCGLLLRHMDSLVASTKAWLPQGMGNLSSLARDRTHILLECGFLTTAPPGKSLKVFMSLTESLESHPAHTSIHVHLCSDSLS